MIGPAGTFSTAWPVVVGWLERSLRSWGVERSAREEIIQETGIRAWSKGVPFTCAEDLYPWARTVAQRQAIDHRRRELRRPPESSLDDDEESLGPDLASLVETRLAVDEVWHQLRALSVEEREAIVSTVCGHAPWTRAKQLRIAFVRHRVRSRLREALDGMVAAVGYARIRLRAIANDLTAPTAVVVASVFLPGVAAMLSDASSDRVVVVPATPTTTTTTASTPLPVPATRVHRTPGAASTPSAPPDPGTPNGGGDRLGTRVTVPSPTGGPLAGGGVGEGEDDHLRLCVRNIRTVGDLCPVDLDPTPS